MAFAPRLVRGVDDVKHAFLEYLQKSHPDYHESIRHLYDSASRPDSLVEAGAGLLEQRIAQRDMQEQEILRSGEERPYRHIAEMRAGSARDVEGVFNRCMETVYSNMLAECYGIEDDAQAPAHHKALRRRMVINSLLQNSVKKALEAGKEFTGWSCVGRLMMRYSLRQHRWLQECGKKPAKVSPAAS